MTSENPKDELDVETRGKPKTGPSLITKALKKQKPKKDEAKSAEEKEKEKLAAKLETKRKMKELRERSSETVEKNFLDPQTVERLLSTLCEGQDYQFRATEVRNVLLVGRSRTGKTTVVKTLRGVENVIKPLTIFSETRNVNFQSFSLQGKNTLDYTFHIIDTPGLFEVKRAGQQARTDEEIINMISDCLKNEITKIHCIILFCSLTAGVDNTDLIAMKKLIECFGTDTHMAICVTRAESMDRAGRTKIIKELQQHEEMGKMLKLVDDNIFFMGAIDPEKMVSEEYLKQNVNQVMKDRLNLLDFLFLCDDSVKIEELKFVSTKRDAFKRNLQEKSRLINELSGRDLKDEKLFLLAKNTVLEVKNFKHMVSLFDAASLDIYAKMVFENEKLSEKVEEIEAQPKKE